MSKAGTKEQVHAVVSTLNMSLTRNYSRFPPPTKPSELSKFAQMSISVCFVWVRTGSWIIEFMLYLLPYVLFHQRILVFLCNLQTLVQLL